MARLSVDRLSSPFSEAWAERRMSTSSACSDVSAAGPDLPVRSFSRFTSNPYRTLPVALALALALALARTRTRTLPLTQRGAPPRCPRRARGGVAASPGQGDIGRYGQI